MKKVLILVCLMVCGLVGTARSQTVDCPSGFVCLPQAVANDTASKLAELVEARKTIAEFLKERGLVDVERATHARLVERLEKVIELDAQISARKDKLIEQLYQAVEKSLDLVTKLTDRLMKPKSGWDKFVDALTTIGKIAIGIIIGGAL